MLEQRVGVEVPDGLLGVGVDVVVDALPLTAHRIQALALDQRLVGTSGIDLVRCLAVEPVVRATQAQALGGDHAHVVGREALTQQARVERVDALVSERLHALVARSVCRARLDHAALDLFALGEERDLHLVDDRRILVQELGADDLAQVADQKALAARGLADADPVDVALAHVPHALGAVDQVMDLALENRLEIGLHLAARHLDPDAQRQRRRLSHVTRLRPDHRDLAVFDLRQLARVHVLERRCAIAAKLDMRLLLAHALALKGRAVGHRDRHFGDLDLAAAHLEALLHDAVDRHRRDHVLVRTDASGQDLRDIGVGDGGEAVRDRARCRCVLLFRHLAQGHHEREDAVLAVVQVARVIPSGNAAKAQGYTVGEPERIDRGRDVLAERDEPCLPADLHASLDQLLRERDTVRVAGDEDVEVLLLQLARDAHRVLARRRCADHCGEARR